MPRAVSVVLPTYNRADTLPRSIASVLKQSYGDLELIVVDDGSTDDTAAVVRGIGDTRIEYIKLDRNRGQSVARNAGIAASTARLIAFQDSDDIWHPDKLARQIGVLDGNLRLDGVYCDLRRIPIEGEPYLIRAPDLVRGATFDRRPSLYQSFAIGIQSCVLRKAALDRVGSFREDMRCFEDLDLLLRLAKARRLQRIPEALVDYFESSGVSQNGNEEARARIILFRRHGYRAFFANREAWTTELRYYLQQVHNIGKANADRLGSVAMNGGAMSSPHRER